MILGALLRCLGLALLLLVLVGATAVLTAEAAPSPPDARVLRDQAYGPDPRQRIDVYLPDRTDKAPVLLMVHGGGWVIGEKDSREVVGAKAARWLPKGYVLVSVGYRLSPEADPLEQARDVARALAYAQGQAGAWGADPDRFLLMGHSAGGHLVALLAADPALAREAGARPWLGTVVLDGAAYDVEQIMRRWRPRLYERVFGEEPGAWRAASPLHRLAGAPRPMLLVCSGLRPRPCGQADLFAAKARRLGGRVEVLKVPLSHRDINRTLGEEGEYTARVETFLRELAGR